MDPIVVKEVLSTVVAVLPKLVELFERAGGRDAFLVAVDTTLTAARTAVDADLNRKHGK